MRFWRRRQLHKWLAAPPAPGRSNLGGTPLPLKFSVEPIIGHRYWRVAVDNGELALQSIHVPWVWDREETAHCNNSGFKFGLGGRHEEPAPSLECACGLYAELPDTPIREWWFSLGGRVYASGEVELSGRVIKCQRGYKAQYAAIRSPIFLDVSCTGAGAKCPNPVRKVSLPTAPMVHYYGHCKDHLDVDADMLDATVWMDAAAQTLSERYDMEVLHWR